MDTKVYSKKSGLISQIINSIQCGLYEFGEKFPSEQKISEEFNISRTITRRAMLDLIDMGILSRKTGFSAILSSNALQIIESRRKNAAIQVSFILPPAQIENPIIRNIFNTFLNHISNKINVKVDFFDYFQQENINALETDVAVIVGNKYNSNTLHRIKSKVKELLLLNNNNPDFNFIVPDNRSGGRLMAEHFITCGHRKIGCLYSLREGAHGEFFDRYEGAKDFFKENGISLASSLPFAKKSVTQTDELNSDSFNYLQQTCPGMTGILCLMDSNALSLYNLFRLRGIKVPDDISLIGFDDQLYSRMVEPGLTTIKYPMEAMGLRLAKAIEDIAEHGSISIQEQITPILLKRKTVKIL